jgi:hypothetical protein
MLWPSSNTKKSVLIPLFMLRSVQLRPPSGPKQPQLSSASYAERIIGAYLRWSYTARLVGRETLASALVV